MSRDHVPGHCPSSDNLAHENDRLPSASPANYGWVKAVVMVAVYVPAASSTAGQSEVRFTLNW